MELEEPLRIMQQLSLEDEFCYLNKFFQLKEPVRKNYVKVAQILGLRSFQMIDGSLYLNENEINSNSRKVLLTKMIEQSYLKVLSLNSIGTSQIINELNIINWKNLKSLFLDRNCISSIQPLTTVSDLSSLEVLSLAYNRISNVKALIKLYSPRLKTLSMDGNKISQVRLDLYHFEELSLLTLEVNIVRFLNSHIAKTKPRNQQLQISICQNKNYLELTQKSQQFRQLFHSCRNRLRIQPKTNFGIFQNPNYASGVSPEQLYEPYHS